MSSLDHQTFRDIVNLLIPYCADPASRKTLLDSALLNCSVLHEIDWTGSARDFTIRVVRQLLTYGECEAQKPTMVMLLAELREQVGLSQQGQIDALIKKIPLETVIKADDEWLETRSLIVASGASARWLGLENEEKLVGHGLTSCATCDGAFYRNVPVCVIGGGDSAAEEAIFLTRFASKVYLIHRRDKLRASKIMADRVLECEKVEPIWNTVVTKYIPDEKGEMRAVLLRNVETHEERELSVACVFVAIGHDPNTKAFQGKLETDPDGYLLVRHLAESKHPGVFIAGDVADRVYKQAITAAGSGCAAAMEAEKYLSGLEK